MASGELLLEEEKNRHMLRLGTHFQGSFGHDHSNAPGTVVDLSKTGAGMTVGMPFEVGEHGDLHIPVLKLRVKAEVRWCLPFQNTYRLGLEFHHHYDE